MSTTSSAARRNGSNAGCPRMEPGPFLFVAGQVLRSATATCGPDTLAGTVRRELPPGPDSVCAVTTDQGVLGRVRRKDLPEDDGVRAETFMQRGRRPFEREELPALLDRMRRPESRHPGDDLPRSASRCREP
jgi:hypothetical protein